MAQRAQWGSTVGFILAAAGSAVGLGNIWRFPYTTGENGGGAFVLVYLICVALVGLPIMMSEIMIGRAAQRQPVAAFHALQGRKSAWAGIGWLGVVAGFIIGSFYIVVAGWAMDYTLKSVTSFTTGIADTARVEAMQYRAETTLESMRLTLIEHDVARGMSDIERAHTGEVAPSAWQAFQDYNAVLATTPDRDRAARQLLDDAELKANIDAARIVQDRIDVDRRALDSQVRADIGALSDADVRKRAEDLFRRQKIRESTNTAFGALASDGWMSLFWTLLFMLLTMGIVFAGISGGIEKACLILMPALFILMGVLVVYGMFTSGFAEAMSFVFKPDFHKMRPSSFLEALGQAFFSLSLGMGAMITYGSYQRTKKGLAGQASLIAGLDTLVALLACMMIFPIAFTFGQSPEAGPGLVFQAMPLAFAEIGPAGTLLGTMFFGLLVFAALTSSISILEVVASYFIDERNWSRPRAVLIVGGLMFLLSIPTAFDADPDLQFDGWHAGYGQGFLDSVSFLSSNWMLPAGGFLISIYAGWVMPARLRAAEVEGMAPAIFMAWLVLARFIAPLLVILVLLDQFGVLQVDEWFR
jgi:NSS family neurotransmitter:Na+ symporter